MNDKKGKQLAEVLPGDKQKATKQRQPLEGGERVTVDALKVTWAQEIALLKTQRFETIEQALAALAQQVSLRLQLPASKDLVPLLIEIAAEDERLTEMLNSLLTRG